jgi:hypothetical protein
MKELTEEKCILTKGGGICEAATIAGTVSTIATYGPIAKAIALTPTGLLVVGGVGIALALGGIYCMYKS